MPEFYSTYPSIGFAYLMDIVHDKFLLGDFLENRVLIMFKISLLGYTKQSTKTRDSESFSALCMQVIHCLVPAFFLMGMLNFASATLIISS